MKKPVDYKNHRIYIKPDENEESPRRWDNMAKMYCFHGRHNVGDKHDYNQNNYKGWEGFLRQLNEDFDIAAVEFVYMYDHSGRELSTTPFSCSFDSGQVGFAFVTKETALHEFGQGTTELTPEIIEKCRVRIKGEIETYNMYLAGDVWYFVIKEIIQAVGSNGKKYEIEEEVESIGGYYGYEYCLAEAKSSVDYIVSSTQVAPEPIESLLLQNEVTLQCTSEVTP